MLKMQQATTASDCDCQYVTQSAQQGLLHDKILH